MRPDIERHNVIDKIFYQVVTLFPNRTKAPSGFDKHIIDRRTSHRQQTELGLLVTIETTDKGEAFRLEHSIRAWNAKWIDLGSFQEIRVLEVRRIDVARQLSEADNTAASHSDSLYKRLFALANGVQPTNAWIEEDEQAQKAHELARAEESAALDASWKRYVLVRSAFQQEETDQHATSGSQLSLAEWSEARPKFPAFEEWRNAGESVRMLPAPAAVVQAPTVEAAQPEVQEEVVERDLDGDILEILNEDDASVPDLATELKATEGDVRAALARLIERGSVEEITEGTFGVPLEESGEAQS